MKVMDHMKSLPAMPLPLGNTELEGAQTYHTLSIYSKPDSEQQFRIVFSKRSIQVTLGNSLFCKRPKNSTLPASLPQHCAPCDSKNLKCPKFLSPLRLCHHCSHLTLTLKPLIPALVPTMMHFPCLQDNNFSSSSSCTETSTRQILVITIYYKP